MTPLSSSMDPKQKQKQKTNKSPEQVIQNKYCTNGRSTKGGQEYEKRINNVKSSIECNALESKQQTRRNNDRDGNASIQRVA